MSSKYAAHIRKLNDDLAVAQAKAEAYTHVRNDAKRQNHAMQVSGTTLDMPCT